MTGSSDQPAGGELNAAITSALVGIQTEHLGRGPSSASTFHHGRMAGGPKADAVTTMRHNYQEAMEKDYRTAGERITGRKVEVFISGNHLDPDVAAELFILDAPRYTPSWTVVATA